MHFPSMFEGVWRNFFGQTDAHTETRIVFIFAYVAFAGLTHMTYHRETSDTNRAVKVRVKLIFFLKTKLFHSNWLRACIDYF
jgi:hypothetical protein